MSWTPLSDVILRLQAHIPRLPRPSSEDLRIQAAQLVLSAQGTLPAPEWLNIGALALSMPRMVVHRLTVDAAQQVRSTELRALPGEPPRLLRGAFIVESRRPERHTLFGQTVSLGGYWLDDRLYLIGLDYPDGIRVESVAPVWEESELGAEERESPFVDDPQVHRAWAEQAAEWIITLGALMDAEGTPIEVEDWQDKGKRKTRNGMRGTGGDDWIVRRVSLSPSSAARVTSRTEPSDESTQHGDRQLAETWVRGYVRRQPYGPGRALRKWVYIHEHQARRWVSARPVRVDVEGDGNQMAPSL